jgi:hypothetical protein
MTGINLALVALAILVGFWVLVKGIEIAKDGWEKVGLAEAGLMLSVGVIVLLSL